MPLVRSFQLLAAAGLLLVATQQALAHKVNIFAYVEGDSVHTESYFNDGKKCVNSTITAHAPSGEQLVEGRTDDQGLFAFALPQLPPARRGDLRLVLTASMGHRAEYTLPARELWGNAVAAGSEPAVLPPASGAAVARGSEPAVLPPAGDAAVAAVSGDLAQIVDQVLTRQLSPLTEAVRQLERQQEKASFRDVLGGIGYILGLLGLYYYFRGRSR